MATPTRDEVAVVVFPMTDPTASPRGEPLTKSRPHSLTALSRRLGGAERSSADAAPCGRPAPARRDNRRRACGSRPNRSANVAACSRACAINPTNGCGTSTMPVDPPSAVAGLPASNHWRSSSRHADTANAYRSSAPALNAGSSPSSTNVACASRHAARPAGVNLDGALNAAPSSERRERRRRRCHCRRRRARARRARARAAGVG